MYMFMFLFIFIRICSSALQRLPSISLNEQSSIGTSIYDLRRVYSSKTSIQFSFLSDSSSHNSFFILDSLTGHISIKRMIDREELCQTHTCNCQRCLLTLEIIASSQTIDILSLDILIENINDNPPKFPLSIFIIRLNENTDLGHTASFPAATDLDSQDRLEYRLVPYNQTADEDLFQTFAIINLQTENQLGLRLLKNLDREQRTSYQMKVLATDGEHTGQLILDIQIVDANDNVPKFEHEQYHIKLREDTPINAEILHIHAYDQDEGLNALINYTLITDSPSLSFPFVINTSTGIVQLVQALDYEYETKYHFNIRARDNGPDAVSVYAQVQVDVIDVNDCSPEIEFILPDMHLNKKIFVIEEEKDLQTRLFHLSVSDKDSFQTKINLKLLTYNHLFQLNEQYNDLYSLILIGRLDREQQEDYELIFQAIDQPFESALTTEKSLTIHLLDINDSPPILDSYPTPININENNPTNIQLIQFHARDFDAPNTSNSLLTFSLLPSNDSRFFHIDSQLGILSVGNISFDYESKSQYNLILNISDHGTHPKRLETLQSIVIHINNLNDNSPQFEHEQYSFQILENAPVGTMIGQIKAFDADIDTILHYELIEHENLFSIDLLTGHLFTKALFDYETNSTYNFHAIVKDNDDLHSSRVPITIELIDINDNPPIIKTVSTISIPTEFLTTNLSKPIVLTTIIASDRDAGANGNLTYAIIDGNQNRYFRINNRNGTITNNVQHIPQGQHRLLIKVCDQGNLFEKCSTTNLHIQIGDETNEYFVSNENENKNLMIDENLLTNQIFLVIIISSIFTLVISITMGILCAICCKQKRYHHRSSELLQSTDADKLLSTNNQVRTKKNYVIGEISLVFCFVRKLLVKKVLTCKCISFNLVNVNLFLF